MPRSETVLDRLTTLHPKLIDLSLDRIERLLAALGEPQSRLPPVVHIAGTNGKGSTIAFLKAMAEAAGLRVHAYTSPHLVRFNERIVLAGADIGETDLAALLEECEAVNGGRPITFFEITTAAALLAFSRAPADLLLLETGLGGRYDATNVVAKPALCAITPISMDHMHYLGNDLRSIAFEKTGILKPGVPCVSAFQLTEPAEVIVRQAREMGATLSVGGRDWTVTPKGDGVMFEDDRDAIFLPLPALRGRHQIDNAGLAIECLRRLESFAVGEDAIARGMGTVRWPGRLQHLDRGDLAELVPPGWELWLDGAHNPGASHALGQFIAAWADRPVFMILGMLNNRDPVEFLKPLAPQIAALKAVDIPRVESSAAAGDLAAAGQSLGIEATAADGVAAAVREFSARRGGPARILIGGSLYLAGHVLAVNGV